MMVKVWGNRATIAVCAVLCVGALMLVGCSTDASPDSIAPPATTYDNAAQPVLPEGTGDPAVLTLSGDGLRWPAEL